MLAHMLIFLGGIVTGAVIGAVLGVIIMACINVAGKADDQTENRIHTSGVAIEQEFMSTFLASAKITDMVCKSKRLPDGKIQWQEPIFIPMPKGKSLREFFPYLYIPVTITEYKI